MRGQAPVETMGLNGWIMLAAVVIGAVVILSVSIWWDNRRTIVFRPESLPLPIAHRKPDSVPKLPLVDVVTAPDVYEGRHRRPAGQDMVKWPEMAA